MGSGAGDVFPRGHLGRFDHVWNVYVDYPVVNGGSDKKERTWGIHVFFNRFLMNNGEPVGAT